MREIEFQEAGMKNFGPYTEEMVLQFPNNQLNLLTGPNGIGKTMSLDSIPFTLYGITSKKAKGDEVVNNVVGKNCKTWVKFKVDKDQYIATRYQKYSKHGNTVILNKNGKNIKSGHREVLPEIERLICPQKAFMNTLMFGQKVKDFFTDLVDSDKKEIFRKILGLEQYLEFYKQTDVLLKNFKKLKNDLTNRIEINKGLLEDTISQIKILADQKVRFEEQKKQAIEEFKKSVGVNKGLLDNWNTTLDSLTPGVINLEETAKELTKVQNEIEYLEQKTNTKLQELTNQQMRKESELKDEAIKKKNEITSEFAVQMEELNASKTKLTEEGFTKKTEHKDFNHEIDLKISKLRTNQENNKSKINEIENSVLNDELSICPTCEQDVTEVKENFVRKIEAYSKQIEIDESEIKDLLSKKENVSLQTHEQLKTYLIKIDEITKDIGELKLKETNELNEVDNKLSELKQQVNEIVNKQKEKILNEQSQTKKDLENKESELQAQKLEKEELQNEINETKEKISDLERTIKNLEEQIEKKKTEEYDETQLKYYFNKRNEIEKTLKDSECELENNERQITIHEFWKSGFSSTGIPSMLIDDSIPFMNDKIAEYLELLTNGRYIVSFDTLAETKAGDFRDKISVHVLDTHTKANTRTQLSGGQTRIIDIATILTLGDLQANIQNVKINILLFDEIFDSLDYENATYVSKVLNKLKMGKSIYVISHQLQEQLEADEILEYK